MHCSLMKPLAPLARRTVLLHLAFVQDGPVDTDDRHVHYDSKRVHNVVNSHQEANRSIFIGGTLGSTSFESGFAVDALGAAVAIDCEEEGESRHHQGPVGERNEEVLEVPEKGCCQIR